MRRLLFTVLFLVALPLCAQQKGEPSKCTDTDTPEFQHFHQEFTSALIRKDPLAVSFLVHFPLKVNTERGTILIPDAPSLEGHFDQIFTAATIKDILSTGKDVGCRYGMGLMYGAGSAWISNSDTVAPKNGHPVIQLYVVNVMGDAAAPLPHLIYACRVLKHRIAIDEVRKNGLRYRSWDGDKSAAGAPDIEILHGKEELQGSGVCAYATYTFTKSTATYEIEVGIGCGDGSEPKAATGSLSVSVNGKPVTQARCY